MSHPFDIDSVLKDCQRGDLKGQEKLYKRYYGEMMGVCLRYTGNREDALEVLNDGFMKVFKALKKKQKMSALHAWIRRIMINTAIDHYRANKRHYYGMDVAYMELPKDEHSVIEHLSAEAILELIKELPDSYRMVFNLYVLEGHTHTQIGEMLGISDGTSRSNFAKARYKLQKLVKERYKMMYKNYVG